MKHYTIPTLLLLTFCTNTYADTTAGQTTTIAAPKTSTATPAPMVAPKSSTATPATMVAPKSSTATPATMVAPKSSTATPETVVAPKSSTATPATITAPVLTQNKKIDCHYTLVSPAASLPHDVLTRWASHAAMQTFTYDYKNVKTQLTALKQCYSTSGWESYTKALKQSGNVASTKKDKLSVTANAGGAAHIVSQKTVNKKPVWKISVPIEVVYKNSSKTMKQLLSVKLTVGISNDKHLGIDQIIASPRVKSDNTKLPAKTEKPTQNNKPKPNPATKTSLLQSNNWEKVIV